MRRDRQDAALLALIGGALEPGRAEDLAAELEQDAALRDRLEQLRADVRPAPGLGASSPLPPVRRWRIPPPGRAGGRRPVPVRRVARAVLSDGPVAPGGSQPVVLAPGDEHAASRVLLLRQVDDGWTVRWPRSVDEVATVAELLVDGRLQLAISVDPEPGPQRWAIALLPEAVPIGWRTDDPWSAVRDAVERGDASVSSLEIDVG